MTTPTITRIASLKTAEAFSGLVRSLNLDLRFEPAIVSGSASALLRPLAYQGRSLANRWSVHPM